MNIMVATIDDRDFIATLNNMLSSGQMTMEQIQSYLNALGYTAEISKETQTMSRTITYDASGAGGILAPLLGHGTIVVEEQVPLIKSIKAMGSTAPTRAASSAPMKSSKSGGGGGGKKSGGGGGSAKKEEPWENDLDRLYNLLEEITEKCGYRIGNYFKSTRR